MNSIEKNKKKSKMVVFDFDETLVKSQDVFYVMTERAIRKLCLPCSEYVVKHIYSEYDKEFFGWGKNLNDQIYIYKKHFQPLITLFSSDYYFIKQMAFFDGIKNVIKMLAKTDIALAIASSRDLISILNFLNINGVENEFNSIKATEGGLNYPDKPDTAVVRAISEELNIPLDRAIMIGDLPCDIQMGKKAGMKTIAVEYSEYSNREKIKKENPDVIIENNNARQMVKTIKKLLASKTK